MNPLKTVSIVAGMLAVLPASQGEAIDLQAAVGTEVEIAGVVAATPWQHLIQPVERKKAVTIDIEGQDQIVSYVDESFACTSGVSLWGKPIVVRGQSKRPGKEDPVSEIQLDAAEFVCIPEAAELPALIDKLADERIAKQQKRVIEEQLVAAGKSAIPLLIEHLADSRHAWVDRRIRNMGERMSRPPALSGSVPGPAYGGEQLTVGSRCNHLLLRIITPRNYRSAKERPFTPRDAGSDRWMFRVEDWKAWWNARRTTPLADIHQEMKPVIDRWYESGGSEQLVR